MEHFRLLIWKVSVFPIRQNGLQPSGKFPARQQDAPPASKALQADIGTQAGDSPIITTTRVLLAQP